MHFGSYHHGSDPIFGTTTEPLSLAILLRGLTARKFLNNPFSGTVLSYIMRLILAPIVGANALDAITLLCILRLKEFNSISNCDTYFRLPFYESSYSKVGVALRKRNKTYITSLSPVI